MDRDFHVGRTYGRRQIDIAKREFAFAFENERLHAHASLPEFES
jgi:hypothetical protein